MVRQQDYLITIIIKSQYWLIGLIAVISLAIFNCLQKDSDPRFLKCLASFSTQPVFSFVVLKLYQPAFSLILVTPSTVYLNMSGTVIWICQFTRRHSGMIQFISADISIIYSTAFCGTRLSITIMIYLVFFKTCCSLLCCLFPWKSMLVPAIIVSSNTGTGNEIYVPTYVTSTYAS